MTTPDLSRFRHRYTTRVRTFQVDRQNVVHNIWYFFILEEARVEFIRELGLPVDADAFVTHSRYYVVRNTCDYHAPALFDHDLTVHSRVAAVRNTSILFEHVIMNDSTGFPAATATHVLVHVNVDTDRPERVPDAVRQLVREHEGANAEIQG